MAINPHDDYEKLAKLLYPSIEASGNVYYGQTRKLTMDEVLNKNDLGFESHVESKIDKFDNNELSNSYFCWKLGPLNGNIRVNTASLEFGSVSDSTFPDVAIEFKQSDLQNEYSSYFAKYKVIKNNNDINEILSSGNYKTYEFGISLQLESIIATHGEAPISDGYSDKNFYISDEYLYVAVLNNAPYIQGVYIAESDIELYFQCEDNYYVQLRKSDYNGDISNTYEYSIDHRATWQPVSFYDVDGTYIDVPGGTIVYFRCTNFADTFSSSRYVYFNLNSGYGAFTIGGNVNSMLSSNFKNITDLSQFGQYCLTHLFYNCDNVSEFKVVLPATKLTTDCYSWMFYNTSIVKAPALPAKSLAGAGGCYKYMFAECTHLTSAPDLPADTSHISCYKSMFENCTSLESACECLPAVTLQPGCYERMFYGCTSLVKGPVIYALYFTGNNAMSNMFNGCSNLNEVTCLYRGESFDSANMSNWLDSVAGYGTLFVSPYRYNNQWYTDVGAKPNHWSWSIKKLYTFNTQHIEDCSHNMYKQDYMLVYGCDNRNNGRGLLNNSTINNMEKTFDEHNAHPMSSYNEDGSYNQEVWGYKTFNSPILFRNGVYTECTNITDFYNSESYNGSKITLNNDAGSILLSKNSGLATVLIDSVSGSSEATLQIAANTADSSIISASNYIYTKDTSDNPVVKYTISSDQTYSKQRSIVDIVSSKYQGQASYRVTLNDSNSDSEPRGSGAMLYLVHNNVFNYGYASLAAAGYNSEYDTLSISSPVAASIRLTGRNENGSLSECNLSADTVKINSVPILSFEKPYNTATFVNGGIYLIVMRHSALSAVTAGNILFATVNGSSNEWAVERGGTTNYGLNVGMINFTSSGVSVNTNLSILDAGDYLGVRLMLLSPAFGINTNYSSALAICIREKS